ncbi:MAG: cadmium-translocating P-type ATPase [Oscillospiraceae bacterium]|nr:cadmium-translocating P-type ATPase [Oscillospiraceae bacterium]
MTRKQKKLLIRIIVSAVLFAGGLFLPHEPEQFSVMWFVRLAVFLAAYLTAGYDILWKAVRNIARGQVFDENFLMAIASIGAMIIGEYSEGAAVMIFYQVGELFQALAVGKSRKSIADMMDINPESANVERDGEVLEVEPDEVEIGETIVVKPGEKVPLDGVVVFGSSGLDTAALTGESALRDVTVGDEIFSGSVNANGLLKIQVTKPYSDSTVSKILELVENSSESKAKTESFITRFARVYTPIVVGSAVLLAVIPSLIFGNWSDWIYRALTFLVVSCPCALVISVPLSYFGGIGAAAKRGIMIKGANYLETLAKAKIFVFDKTGTLTKGSFSVSEIRPDEKSELSENELLNLCAAAEKISNHPIARSIVKAAEGIEIPTAENAEEIAGFGVRAIIDGKEILAGNARFMVKEGIFGNDSEEFNGGNSPGTVVFCAADGKYAGCISVSDTPKDNAKEALAELDRLCNAKKIMLTGDRQSAAEDIAQKLGIDEVRAQLLPDGKVKAVEEIFAEKPNDSALAFVGDGMNDAPSLARADVGIAMGALGSDAAIEAADVVLMNDNIGSIPLAVRISAKTRRIVIQNIVFALAVKAAVLILSALGFANMWAAVFADVGVSVLAILNAMRTLSIKE